MPDDVKRPTRTYDSPGRRAQARRTQAAVVRAALDLFLAHGYARTTMTEIAEAAQVSVETVYRAFGTKAALLHRVWDVTIGGDDEQIVFHERPEVVALRAEPDLARRLRLHAAFFTRTAHRIAPFNLMVHAAAGAEPAAAEMLAEMGRQRLVGMTEMARAAASTGQLAVTEEDCRDLMWAMSDGLLWHQLVVERGWTDERFAAWLGRTWVSMLVAGAGADADVTAST